MAWPQFTWDARVRQYKDARGRFVPRRQVRQALDEAIEQAKRGIDQASRDLQAGRVNLPGWQLEMERQLKAIHTMSAAAAAGGWAQATPKDWSAAGNRIKEQFKYLENFAYQIENGLPLDGRFLHRGQSYAAAGSGTYEKVLRGIDNAKSIVIKERRLLHSERPCTPCLGYQAKGWQPPGVLPDIGEECLCGSRCQCTFERKTLPLSAIKFKQSGGAKANDYATVVVDVAKLDAGFQKDVGFAIGKKGAGAIGGRIPAFKAWLRKFIPRGVKVEQSDITVNDDGKVAFIDGRHRFAVLRDLGMRFLPVSVPREMAGLARRLFGKTKPHVIKSTGGIGGPGPASTPMAARGPLFSPLTAGPAVAPLPETPAAPSPSSPTAPILPGRPIAERIAAWSEGHDKIKQLQSIGSDYRATLEAREAQKVRVVEAERAWKDAARGKPKLEAKEVLQREQHALRERSAEHLEAAKTSREAAQNILTAPRRLIMGMTHGAGSEFNEPDRDAVLEGLRWVQRCVDGSGVPQFAVQVNRVQDNHPQRSYCTPYEVKLAKYVDPGTAVHEFGHYLDDPKRLGLGPRSREFLDYRVGDEAPARLDKLLPKHGYLPHEEGRKDKFKDAFGEDRAWYVGKFYKEGDSTEITSMGMEMMFKDPVGFAQADPEFAAYVLGLMHGPLR